MEKQSNQNIGRVIGWDSHPDTFTAAIIQGDTPARAIVQNVFNKVPMRQMEAWARKHLRDEDTIVLEASGNSFAVARCLRALGLRVEVLESCQMGRLKEAHANNDKISAIRIGKAYLAGTAKIVWVPDLQTQQRRDWYHAHRKAVKRGTQMRNRLQSYLSDNNVRLEELQFDSQRDRQSACEQIRRACDWSQRQWRVIEGMLMELAHAEEQREYWRSLIAQEVLEDPMLVSLVRLCGVRDVIAFALGAIIGDITRFASPGKLVKYVGLNPAFDDSGNNSWTGGIRGHGRKDLRSLLIEAAQSILRSSDPLAKWGKKLLARKGEYNLVVAAIARKLTVAIWYLMTGSWSQCQEIDSRTNLKIGKIVSQLGPKVIESMGKTRKELRTQTFELLQSGRTYKLRPAAPSQLHGLSQT